LIAALGHGAGAESWLVLSRLNWKSPPAEMSMALAHVSFVVGQSLSE
jgi:hypothetical protein